MLARAVWIVSVSMGEDGFGKLNDSTYDACFGALTPAEHKLLELVGEGYKAKQIERLGGGSYNRVNTLTREIRRRLGPLPNGNLVERPELARAYRAWKARYSEDQNASQRIDVYSVDVSKPAVSGSDRGVDHSDAPIEQGDPLAEEQQPYAVQEQVSPLLSLVPLRTAGRVQNDLNLKATMIAFAILACLALVAAGSTASLLEAFNDLVRS